MRILLAVVATLCSLTTVTSVSAADLLTIGSNAPQLDIEHWVQNGGGKFEPVTKFKPGKVYIVEFWATWCGPCVQSMPHIVALQKKYSDSVQVVSISDEDLQTVESFLSRPVRGAKPDAEGKTPTYRDLTSSYCLTTDPDRSSSVEYMEASAQGGIPTAFIVGKDAKIEWIGHPMEMDGPLNQVVNDKWDREAFAKQIREQQEAEKAMQGIFADLDARNFDNALKSLDEILSKKDNFQLAMLKMQVLVTASKPKESEAYLNELFKKYAGQGEQTNLAAWNIYEMASQGAPIGEPLIVAATSAAKAALSKSKVNAEKASIMDTLAHLTFLQGNLDLAIAMEEKALTIASASDRAFMENFLSELKAQKEKAGK